MGLDPDNSDRKGNGDVHMLNFALDVVLKLVYRSRMTT
jgi:hypothetical protein